MEAATAAMTMTVVLVTLEEVEAPETGAAVWLVSVPSVTVAVTRLMALEVLEGFVETDGVSSDEAGACSTADGVADGVDAEEGGTEEAELGGAEEALLGTSDDGATDPESCESEKKSWHTADGG